MIIESLELESFGKYTSRNFAFKPLTVFFGVNESGKTTILDAIFLQLLDRAVNSGTVQLLQSRYGACSAKLKPEALCKTLTLSELENFYLVRSSRIPVEFSGNADIGSIKTKLLDGRVNIQTLLDDLKKELGDRAEASVGKRRTKLRQLADSLEKAIRESAAVINNYAEKTEQLKKTILGLKALEEERQRKELAKAETLQKRQSLRQNEEQGTVSLLYDRLQQWLTDFGRYKTERQQWMTHYGSLDQAVFDNLFEREAELRKQLDDMRDAATGELKKREGKILLSAKLQPLKIFSIVGAVCGIISAAGLVLGFLAKSGTAFVASGIALAASLIVLLLRYSKAHALTAEARILSGDDSLSTLRKVSEYAHATSNTDVQAGIETITRELDGLQRKREELLRLFGIPHIQALRAMITEKANMATALDVIKNNLHASVPRSELVAHGINLVPETGRGDEELSRLAEEIENIARSLKDKLGEAPTMKLTDIRLAVKALDDGLRAVESELSGLSTRKDKLIEQKTSLQTELAAFAQKISESADCKKRLDACQKELADLEKEEKAKLVVKDILEHMQEGRNTELQFIEEGMGRYFGSVFSPFTSIKVSDIGKDNILMQDAARQDRLVPMLSQGTQDLFYAGFRMLLGEYLWEGKSGATSAQSSAAGRRDARSGSPGRTKPGFFLWDEPFVSLDNTRLKIAVEMLFEFQQHSGFQHVVFTKDPMLVALLKRQWPGETLQLHELSPLKR